VVAALDSAGIQFPIAAGSSSGSLSAAAVAAGKAADLPDLWRGIAGRSVFSLRRLLVNRSIFDMRTIVHRGIVDLLGDGDLRNAPGEAIAAVTLLPEFHTRYLSSRNEPDMVNVLLGSCFIPGIYGPRIPHIVQNEQRFLFDGGITNNLPIEAAVAAGATDIICVVSRPRPVANKTPIRRRWRPVAPTAPDGSTATVRVIHPLAPLAVRSWELDTAKIAAAIEAGHQAAAYFLAKESLDRAM
jgi:NTE family protein